MTVHILAEVFESDITEGRLLLLALANNANKRGICWPGSVTLASDAGMSRSTVFRSLKVLEKQGLVERRTRKRRNGSLTSNVYLLNREAIRARKRDNADEERREQEEFLRALEDETDPAEPGMDEEPDPPDAPGNSSDRGPSVNSRLVADRHQGSTGRDTRARPAVTRPEPSVEPSVEPPLVPTPDRASRGEHDRAAAPASGAPASPRATTTTARCEHGQTSCRRCETNPRAQVRAAEVDAEQVGRRCVMCIADGPSKQGGTRWIRVLPGTQSAVTPYLLCDHSTSHADAMAELAERETATERARAAQREDSARVTSSAAARAEARQIARCKPADRVQPPRSRAGRSRRPFVADAPVDEAVSA